MHINLKNRIILGPTVRVFLQIYSI